MAHSDHQQRAVAEARARRLTNNGCMDGGNLDSLAVHYLTSTADGILVVNSDGVIVGGNAAAEAMFGFEQHELDGTPVETLIPLRLRKGHLGHRRKYMSAPRPYQMGERPDIVGLRSDGSEFPVDCSITPVVNGDHTYMICALRDMTRQRSAEQALRRQTHELQAIEHRKDQFIATLAHELRNPLAAASNWIALLTRESVPDDLRDRALQALQQQHVQMRRLIEDLSDAGRIRRGEVLLNLKTADLVPIVRLAVEDCRSLIDERLHALKLQLPDTPIPVRADPDRVIQIISNLVSNADRYSPNAGDIIVTVLVEESHAVLKVKDSGIGIPTDELSTVFDVFTRLDPAKAACPLGLGLGLSVVKRLVELHGGTVTAHSDGAGRGSEFVVKLQLAKFETGQEPQPDR